MNDKEKIEELRNALGNLLDEYLQYADNACHCNEYGEDEQCTYCYAQEVLKKTE